MIKNRLDVDAIHHFNARKNGDVDALDFYLYFLAIKLFALFLVNEVLNELDILVTWFGRVGDTNHHENLWSLVAAPIIRPIKKDIFQFQGVIAAKDKGMGLPL